MAIKKRPVSPRQKMINLMYVVLMAMLAMNVSTEVLNGFSIVEESLNRTTGNATKENLAIYEDFDAQMKAKPQKVIPYALLIIRSGDRVLMRQRTERLLQGLWCFPLLEGESSAEELLPIANKKLHLSLSPLRDAGTARHVFTHQIWLMHIYETDAEASASAPAGYEFVPVSRLKDLTLPAAMNAAAALLTR